MKGRENMARKQLRERLSRNFFRQVLQQIIALAGIAIGRTRGKEHGHRAAVPIRQAGAVAEDVAGGDLCKIRVLGPGLASQPGRHRLIQGQQPLIN